MIASPLSSYNARRPQLVSMPKIQSPHINTPGAPPTKTSRSTRSIIAQAQIPPFTLPKGPQLQVPQVQSPRIQLPRVVPQVFSPNEEKFQSSYALNQINYINIPVIPYASTVPLPSIKNPPPRSTLPVFTYRQDSTGNLTRYLVAEDDNRDADPEFGIEQEWILFQRQGDDYDRIAERVTDQERTVKEQYNVPSNSSLNQGITWGPLPYPNFVVPSGDDEYKQLLEYQKTQEDEDD